jgi:hypothetical protein
VDDYIANGVRKPDWIKDPESGELLPIEKDAEYGQILADFHSSECKHADTEVMKFTIADGRTQVVKCCVLCGERIGTPLSQKDKEWVSTLKALPDDLIGSYRDRRNEKRTSLLLALAKKQYADRGRFTHLYRKYMMSSEWRNRRSKVMKRCSGICEGCGDHPATEVHHLSYQHFMDEFLFELVGLCHNCHERLHADELENDVAEQEIANG